MHQGPSRVISESAPRSLRDGCLDLAGALERARVSLTAWGINIPSHSRLEEAHAVLTGVASRGHLWTEERDATTRAVRAMWVASDYASIATSLPPTRVKSVRLELERSLAGPMWPSKGDREALQLQSQHWLTSLFRKHGFAVEHVPFNSRKPLRAPEFFVERSLHKIGIEIKRPESHGRLRASLEDACQKFQARDCYGGVIVEATDLLEGASPSEFVDRAEEIGLECNRYIWPLGGRGFAPGFSRILYLSVVSRGAWQRHEVADDRLQMSFLVKSAYFAQTERSLLHIQGQWLQDRLTTAFDAVGAEALAGGSSGNGA